jgi:hypothetical protein
MEKNSPRWMSKETLSTAFRSAKDLETRENWTTGWLFGEAVTDEDSCGPGE